MACVFAVTSAGTSYAQTVLNLPAVGASVALSQPFMPLLIKGISVHPENAMMLDFIVDPGELESSKDGVTAEAMRLIKYFMASLALPENDLWVNLSPYESDRIIVPALGETAMGQDMLLQDYLLKQLTASLMNPEGDVGRAFWAKVYAEAREKFGNIDIPVDTFNKVWIMPERALVYQHEGKAVVVESRLKVMLESDYLAESKVGAVGEGLVPSRDTTKAILREVIVPVLEEEVNNGKTFAPLRQIYHSLILAHWFRGALKQSILNSFYADKKKVRGIDSDDKEAVQKIYAQYVASFKQGVYNYIKEEKDLQTGESVPRKYFSGGVGFGEDALENTAVVTEEVSVGRKFAASVENEDLFELRTRMRPVTDNPQYGQFSQPGWGGGSGSSVALLTSIKDGLDLMGYRIERGGIGFVVGFGDTVDELLFVKEYFDPEVVIGIDLVKTRVDDAKKFLKALGRSEEFPLYEADMTDMVGTALSGKVDLLVAVNVTINKMDSGVDKFTQGIFDLLAPGGKAFISTAADPSFKQYFIERGKILWEGGDTFVFEKGQDNAETSVRELYARANKAGFLDSFSVNRGLSVYNTRVLSRAGRSFLEFVASAVKGRSLRVADLGAGAGMATRDIHELLQASQGREKVPGYSIDTFSLTPIPEKAFIKHDYDQVKELVSAYFLQYPDRLDVYLKVYLKELEKDKEYFKRLKQEWEPLNRPYDDWSRGNKQDLLTFIFGATPMPLALLFDMQEAGYEIFKVLPEPFINEQHIGFFLETVLKLDPALRYDFLYDDLGAIYYSMQEDPVETLKRVCALLSDEGIFLMNKIAPSDLEPVSRLLPEGFIALRSQREMIVLKKGGPVHEKLKGFLSTGKEASPVTRDIEKAGDVYEVQGLNNVLRALNDNPLQAPVDGGIDLTVDKGGLQVQVSGGEIQFNIDPLMARQLQDAAGLTPVIVGIRPMPVPMDVFLGVSPRGCVAAGGAC